MFKRYARKKEPGSNRNLIVAVQRPVTKIETFILHVPVTGQLIETRVHRVTHWGVVGTILHTDTGLTGFGYTGTHAHRATDRLITDCIQHTYGPLLEGEDAADIQQLWQKLSYFPPVQWVGRAVAR